VQAEDKECNCHEKRPGGTGQSLRKQERGATVTLSKRPESTGGSIQGSPEAKDAVPGGQGD